MPSTGVQRLIFRSIECLQSCERPNFRGTPSCFLYAQKLVLADVLKSASHTLCVPFNSGLHGAFGSNSQFFCGFDSQSTAWGSYIFQSRLDIFPAWQTLCCIDMALHKMSFMHGSQRSSIRAWVTKNAHIKHLCADTLHKLYSYIHVHWIRAHSLAQLKHHTCGVLEDLHSS